jgi:hypothetical protein
MTVQEDTNLIQPAIAAFASAARGEKVLVSIVKGLNYIVQMADCHEAMQTSCTDAAQLMEAIAAAGPVLAGLVSGNVVSDRHVLGMAGAFGLASLFGKSKAEVNAAVTKPLLHDYFDHALLLLAELQILCCVHRIEERGNLLRDIMSDRRIVNISKH